MADVTNQALGGTTGRLGGERRVLSGVIDLGQAVADGYASTDEILMFTLPAGCSWDKFDAVITEALTGTVTATDIGYDSASDPDNLINAQSDTAVGRFTTYEALCETGATLTSSTPFYCSFTYSGTPTAGKVAYRIEVLDAAANSLGLARSHEYTNS